ncbi:MarR family winged helix-turn-helix transcriptional regulator [Kribbella endophytica]
MKDSIDDHVALWSREQADLDPRVEGILVRMQVLTRYLDRQRDAVLASYGLQWWEFKTLHMLRRGGTPYRATPGALAKQLSMSPAAMTNRLDALEKHGYVVRSHDPDDRRKVVATLTKAGRAVWERGIDDIQKLEQDLVRALPAKDQDVLEDLLRRLVKTTEQE